MSNLHLGVANEFAISLEGLDIWHEGHVNDILAVGYSVVTANVTSGVILQETSNRSVHSNEKKVNEFNSYFQS